MVLLSSVVVTAVLGTVSAQVFRLPDANSCEKSKMEKIKWILKLIFITSIDRKDSCNKIWQELSLLLVSSW